MDLRQLTHSRFGFLLQAGASLLLLLIMGFIDEGRYNFDFLFSRTSVLTLGFYFGSLLFWQALLYFWLLRKQPHTRKHLLSFFLAIPLAVLTLMLAVLVLVN